jgi:hypothetical protein
MTKFMIAMTQSSLIEKLVSISPNLEELYREHIDDYDELLPHVFMGEITRNLVEEFSKSTISEEALEVLHTIESSFVNGGDSIEELISVSFVENLVGLNPQEDAIRRYLGKALTKELAKYQYGR